MKEIRTVYIPVEKEVEVKYFVWVQPADDPHFAPSPCYVLNNKYFDTKAEAEAYMAERKRDVWGFCSIREKVEE